MDGIKKEQESNSPATSAPFEEPNTNTLRLEICAITADASQRADCAQHVIFGKCRRGTWVEITESLPESHG